MGGACNRVLSRARLGALAWGSQEERRITATACASSTGYHYSVMAADALRIRPFRADEWPLYRDLRLRALRDSPDAYGSILDLEAALTDAEWAARLAHGVHSARELPLTAECGDELCG